MRYFIRFLVCLFVNISLVVSVDIMEHVINIKVGSVCDVSFVELHRAEIGEHPSSE